MGPQESGIYALYFKGALVYIGKASKGTTKSKRTLRARLSEHVGKIRDRQNISTSDVECRYLTFVSEWWVFAAEFALIVHYKPEWNESGFGSKTPGIGRPGQTASVGGTSGFQGPRTSKPAANVGRLDHAAAFFTKCRASTVSVRIPTRARLQFTPTSKPSRSIPGAHRFSKSAQMISTGVNLAYAGMFLIVRSTHDLLDQEACAVCT